MRALVLLIAAGGVLLNAQPKGSALSARRGPEAPALRVCADPNNLPFTNRALEGFENRLAEMVARDLRTTVEYTWWAQRRGFLRNTLAAGTCDVVMGYPAGADGVETTRPYYRSSYVFVTRADRPRPSGYDDPALRRLRIGVPLVGDDGANAPPAHALSRRGIVANVVGYSVYGDYAKPNPPAALIEAVARGDVDVAAAWGPLAGFFAARARPPLAVTPVGHVLSDPAIDPATQVFDIAMAVRRGDSARRRHLDAFIVRHAREIGALLDRFHVPRLASGAAL